MNKTVYVTVENTLVTNDNKLIESTISRVRELKSKGYTIVLWSAKGRRFAETVRDLHNLRKLVDFCISKPDIVIDADDYPLRGAKCEAPRYLRREFSA